MKSLMTLLILGLSGLVGCKTAELESDTLAGRGPSEIFKVRHVSPNDVRFSPTGDVKSAILSVLDKTTASVDLAMYSLGDAAVIQKIIDLKNSGKKIRVILNKDAGKVKKCLRATKQLEEAKIDVRFINPTMHHKYAIIDGNQAGKFSKNTIVMTGSANWSSSAFSIYDEDWMRFDGNNNFSRSYQDEFNKMWDHSRNDHNQNTTCNAPAGADSIPVVVGKPANVIFTSANFAPSAGKPGSFSVDRTKGVVKKELVEAILNAKTSVDIAHAHFRIREVYDALVEVMQRPTPVKVRLYIDQQEYTRAPINEVTKSPVDFKLLIDPKFDAAASNIDKKDKSYYAKKYGKFASFYEEHLAELGADVMYKAYMIIWHYAAAKQMHTKYTIIDKKYVFTGSYNFSDNSEFGTFENVVTVKQPKAVKQYVDKFESSFASGAGTAKDLIADIKNANPGNILSFCNYGARSVTPAEFADIRAAFYSTKEKLKVFRNCRTN